MEPTTQVNNTPTLTGAFADSCVVKVFGWFCQQNKAKRIIR